MGQLTVGSVMSRRLVLVHPDLVAVNAVQLARTIGVSHFVVETGGRVVGVTCICSLERAEPGATVADCMGSPALTIPRFAGTFQAAQMMIDADVGFLPVVTEDGLVGVITRSDLRRAGFPADDFPGFACSACHGVEHVRCHPEPDTGVAFCIDCWEQGAPDIDYAELGVGD